MPVGIGLSFGIFDSFLSRLGRNQVYGAFWSARTAHKPVQQSRQQALRTYCPNIYTVHPALVHFLKTLKRSTFLSDVHLLSSKSVNFKRKPLSSINYVHYIIIMFLSDGYMNLFSTKVKYIRLGQSL